MKKTAERFIHTLILSLVAMLVVSCELVGLDYQYNYKNKPAPVNEETGMSCYQFIKQRSKLDFSLFFEAVNHADLKEFYETENQTYFLIEDELFAGWLTSNQYATISSVPKIVLERFLKSYTIQGMYHTRQLSPSPIDVPALDGVRIIRMRLYPSSSTSSANLHQFNAGFLSNGTVNYRYIKVSNLKMTNGMAHILDVRF